MFLLNLFVLYDLNESMEKECDTERIGDVTDDRNGEFDRAERLVKIIRQVNTWVLNQNIAYASLRKEGNRRNEWY
jgi:hypothetical protein